MISILVINILHLDLATVIQTAGYVGLFAIIFAESGLFVGFFLPGDSLLFTAGLVASQGVLNIALLVVLLAVAAILGDNVGYWFGAKVGSALFRRQDSYFFRKKHVERTKEFYAQYGPRAVVFARFVPVVRTFTPILAGVGTMPYQTFLRYNIVGGVLWTSSIILLGYFLGAVIPNLETYLFPIVLGIIAVSFLPIFWEIGRKHLQKKDRNKNAAIQ